MSMTPDEMRVAIAEKCGFVKYCINYHGQQVWHHSKTGPTPYVLDGALTLPNYPSDLNAVSEAENVMTESQMVTMSQYLHQRLGMLWGFATALQRCEAFCRVFWPERFV